MCCGCNDGRVPLSVVDAMMDVYFECWGCNNECVLLSVVDAMMDVYL